MDRSGAEGALVEAPKAQRGLGSGMGVFDLKMEHFGAVYI